jgi:hypothetical protein
MRSVRALALGSALGLLFCGAAWAGENPLPEQQEFDKALKKAMPKAAAKPSDGVVSGKLGRANMRKANKLAAEILERRMEKRRKSDLMLLRQAGAADVIVVQGSYDRVQDVLRALKVKHVVVPPHLVAKLPLMSTQTLMVNCPGHLNKAGIAVVRRFVKTGGYLVTTDWAITMLAKAIPGYIARGGRNTGNDVVKVHIHDLDDPWLKQLKGMKEKPRWWLESSSYPIRILNRQKVKVLISSSEMKKKYGHAPIAVSFRYDDGKVLHMTSHFYLQQGKRRTKYEKAKGTVFAASAGLKKNELEALRKKGLDSVKSGDLNSAYSMQQVTANVLVSKQADNKRLLKSYGKRARRKIRLDGKAKGGGRSQGQVNKDYRLRVLQQKGKRSRVRDLFGNEGWVDSDALY